MRENKYLSASDCPVTASIEVIGGKWKPIILWVLMGGPKRFGELNHIIAGIALKVLSRNLKELQESGLIDRKAYPEVPPRVEYSLTEKGQSLGPLLQELSRWSREHILPQA